MLEVHKIFTTLQGEGVNVGLPANFIRLQGCNLRCSWCDTGPAMVPGYGTRMSGNDILAKLDRKIRSVYITGGEPLVQVQELGSAIYLFSSRGFKISVATNGTMPVPGWIWDYKVWWEVDCKCPSANSGIPFNLDWLRVLDNGSLKFVVGNQDDLDFVGSFLANCKVSANILVSPVFPVLSKAFRGAVTKFCIDQNVRLSVQVHKLLEFE